MVAVPPPPFEPEASPLPTGAPVYRVTSNSSDRDASDFNPGLGKPTRYAFFEGSNGTVVPVLYGASSPDVAACETLLHRKLRTGGVLQHREYRDQLMVKLTVQRDLSLASFQGPGLWRLGVAANQLTDTSSIHYPKTVAWAAAAHQAGFDGCVWTSRKCNDGNAYVFFGSSVHPANLQQDPAFALLFAARAGLDWLIDFGTRTGVEVRI